MFIILCTSCSVIQFYQTDANIMRFPTVTYSNILKSFIVCFFLIVIAFESINVDILYE